jgi:methionyl aminopeptidase
VSTTADVEANGPGFSLAAQLETRDRTLAALRAISANIAPGMLEEDAVDMARDLLGTMDMRKGWHKVLVRFGPNTTKDFYDRSEPGVRLRDDDLFFVDIGPVYRGAEGDAGDTFVVGNNPRRDVRALWDGTRDRWRSDGLTGRALYEHAACAADALGWKLNLGLTGHRLSDFPHKAQYAGVLGTVDLTPSPNLWVLEMAIASPDGTFGAFYEDMLLDDQSLQD